MADFNEYKGVWVFCEQRQGALMSTDFELVSEARKLADELGCEVTGLLLGDNVEGIAKELGGYGADKVLVCDSPLLKDYTTDAYAKVVCDMVNEYKPEVLLIGATNIGRDLGPRCAARLHTGLTADATHHACCASCNLFRRFFPAQDSRCIPDLSEAFSLFPLTTAKAFPYPCKRFLLSCGTPLVLQSPAHTAILQFPSYFYLLGTAQISFLQYLPLPFQ